MKLDSNTFKLDDPEENKSDVIQKSNPATSQETVKAAPNVPQKSSQKKRVYQTRPIDYLIHPSQIFLPKDAGIFTKPVSSEIISIEIDGSFVRVLHIRKIKNKYHIKSWAEQPLTNKKLDRTIAIMMALRNAIDLRILRRSRVVLSFFGPEVNIRTITVPQLKGNELKQAVFWKNQKEVLNFSEDSLWDFQVIDEVIEDDKKQLKILTIIAQEQFVNKYLDMLKEINIFPYKVIVKPIALTLAFKRLTEPITLADKNLILIDIGRETTILCFYKSSRLEFVRTLGFGSNKIDQALNQPIVIKDKRIKLDPRKIVIFKRRHGILIEFLKGTDKTYFPFKQLFQFIQPVLQIFISELKRSLAYYQNSYSVDEVNAIFITGSGCNLKNLDKYLAHHIHIPVSLIAPSFPSILSGTYVPGFEFTSCFGATQSSTDKFNFIPKEIRMHVKFKRAKNLLIFLAVLLFIFLGYFSTGKFTELEQYQETTNKMNLNFQKLHVYEVEYEKYQAEIQKVKDELQGIINKLNVDNKIRDMLKIISNKIPEDIVLTAINYIEKDASKLDITSKKISEGVLVIDGLVYRNFISADITLIDFITNLKNSNFFKDVTLAKQRKQIKENVFQFKIECKL